MFWKAWSEERNPVGNSNCIMYGWGASVMLEKLESLITLMKEDFSTVLTWHCKNNCLELAVCISI